MTAPVLRLAVVGWTLLALAPEGFAAQEPDSTPARRIRARVDSIPVQGGVYNRPFLASVGRTAVGG